MNFRTIEDLSKIINNNLYKIPKDVDLIVGVPRSGLLAANMIALQLNKPLTDLDSFLHNKILGSGISKNKNKWVNKPEEARKILLVEDSSATGITFNQTLKKIKKSKLYNKIIFLVIFVNSYTKKLPNIYFDVCEGPRMFEWNYMHHGLLENACVDIDGVLCKDPTEKENDDGKNYIKFISNTKPRVVPSREIGYLVTSRLEKYRSYTEKWLKKNNIKYKYLIMMNVATKEERIRLGNHADFKAEHYLNLYDTCIFIESNDNQAKRINELTGKSVYCVDSGKFYNSFEIIQSVCDNNILQHKDNIIKKIYRKIIPQKIRQFIRKILKK